MTRQEAFNRAAGRDLRREASLRWVRKELAALRAELEALKRARSATARGRLHRRRGNEAIEIRAFT